jgi:hypothetical protein
MRGPAAATEEYLARLSSEGFDVLKIISDIGCPFVAFVFG